MGILCTSLGDVALSQAMKIAGHAGHIEAVLNPYLAVALVLHATFMLVYLFALSREELSFVLPITALDYVLVAVFAAVWAGEEIGTLRWVSSIMVASGVALVVKS